MKTELFAEICTPELQDGAIINDEFTGFKRDYLALHCLIRKYQPKIFFEVGTNMGTGTNIICNANPDMKVYSLDLPPELAHISLQSSGSEGEGSHNIGSKCKFPFIQLFGNSICYDYSEYYPIDGWYIDGEHCYDNVYSESSCARMSGARIIIWHDTDMPEVMKGITDAFIKDKKYKFIRVVDTRISYAILK